MHYPKPFPPPKWLTEQQPRLLFDIWPEKIWADQQVNIACAGTNASPFFYIWDGKDRIYHFETGEDCDIERYLRLVIEGQNLGIKTLCPLIRFWHPQKLLGEHPEWQERYAPDAPSRKPGDQDAQFTNGCWISLSVISTLRKAFISQKYSVSKGTTSTDLACLHSVIASTVKMLTRRTPESCCQPAGM